jgi:alpha/beta superfamily hydrolase
LMVDQIYDPESGKGQLMERSTIIQSGVNTLEAIYLRGKATPPVLIAPAIYASGGNMEGAVSNEISYAVSYNGHASLRFAWQGQGASEGTLPEIGDSLELLQRDLDNAIDHLLECEEAKSLALVALRDGASAVLDYAARKLGKVTHIVLVDPPGETAAQISEIPTFVFFPGEEVIPGPYRDLENCSVVRIPKADRAFRRNLNILGQSIANLLSSPRCR